MNLSMWQFPCISWFFTCQAMRPNVIDLALLFLVGRVSPLPPPGTVPGSTQPQNPLMCDFTHHPQSWWNLNFLIRATSICQYTLFLDLTGDRAARVVLILKKHLEGQHHIWVRSKWRCPHRFSRWKNTEDVDLNWHLAAHLFCFLC